MNENFETNVRDFLKSLTPADFLRIGIDEIAYIRPVRSLTDHDVFAVHAADGTQLSILDTMDMAVATLRHNDLIPVTLH